MYTRRKVRFPVVFNFSWRFVLASCFWSVLIVLLYEFFQAKEVNVSLPVAPLGTIGVAVAFYVGFKNSQSYDRSWEARKIWGGIVNVSRTWANQVITYVSPNISPDPVDPEKVNSIRRSLIYRHIAWLHILRYQLRRKSPWNFTPKGAAKKYQQETDIPAMKKQVEQLLPEKETAIVCGQSNGATQILRWQSEALRQVIENDRLTEEFRYISLMDLITEMYTLQGKCERIKNTPFPRQYAYFSGVFVYIFIVLLPFGIVGEFAKLDSPMVWLTVPLSVLISWIFYTMEKVGDTSEDPFENFINDVPLTALCRTIEIDLREMLGETELPEPLQPVNDILM